MIGGGFFQAVFSYAFVRNALATGTLVAVAAGFVGYFLVARGFTFAAHALPNVGFAGAGGAVLLGIHPAYGLIVATLAAAVGIGLLGDRSDRRDVSIGIVMSFALGLGLMFLALYRGFAQQVYGILFGSIVGITRADTIRALIVCAFAAGVVLFVSRPLLYLTFDPEAAAARGIAVNAIWLTLLCVAALVVSLAVQLVGAMLVFALLVAPAATSSRLFSRPFVALLSAAVLGVVYVWVGILLATVLDGWPVGFFVAAIGLLGYLPARILTRTRPAHG